MAGFQDFFYLKISLRGLNETAWHFISEWSLQLIVEDFFPP